LAGVHITQIAEADAPGGVIVGYAGIELFGFNKWILGPAQVDLAEIGLLGGRGDWSFFGLVADLHCSLGIDCRGEGVDVHGGEEGGGFGHGVPAKRIGRVRVGGDAEGIDAEVVSGLEHGEGATMLVVTQPPERTDGEESERGGDSAGWKFVWSAAGTNFPINERKQRGHDKAENQDDEYDRFVDVDDVPGVPAFGERPERTYAVAVGVVEEDVAEAGEAGIDEKQTPAGREIWVTSFAAAQPPDSVDKGDDSRGDDRDAEERMRETAMVIEGEGGSAEAAEDVEIGGFGGKGEGGGSERGFTVQAGAAEVGAKQEMGDGFQGKSLDEINPNAEAGSQIAEVGSGRRSEVTNLFASEVAI